MASCKEEDSPISNPRPVSKQQVAWLLSELPLGVEQMEEVFDAVSSSSENGYDEEYMMVDLMSSPGAGVGNTKSASRYKRTMRDLIEDHLVQTKSGNILGDMTPEEFLASLSTSDMQIYWPYSEDWDGHTLPTITFAPDTEDEINDGYRLFRGDNGSLEVEEVIVDEDYAMNFPVWVVNSNQDSSFMTLELLRKELEENFSDAITVKPKSSIAETKAVVNPGIKTLVLKEFKMSQHYDSWFAGASEFFVKMGSVENFTASTDAELKLYSPSVTDFIIVVKRKELGEFKQINTVLVSEWTDQLTSCAFLIVEDDGGTKTSWKCEAIVKYNSKSFGFTMDIPYSRYDDIVWRGQLTAKYLEKYETAENRFSGVDIVFEFI
jgi:hypothetical protein